MYFQFLYSSEDFNKEIYNKEWIYTWENTEKETDKGKKYLGNFKKINFFVGANNSGKSRFLRSLLKLELNQARISEGNKSLKYIQNEIDESFNLLGGNNPNSHQINAISSGLNSRKDYLTIISNENLFSEYFSLARQVNSSGSPSCQNYLDKVRDYEREINYIKKNKYEKRIYVPVLRSIHENEFLRDDAFAETIKKNYKIEENVFTGLELYKHIFRIKNSPGNNRKKVTEFEKFLSNHFFNTQEVEITANNETKQILFSIDDNEHPIHDLGDGIQSLIILLFPIFTANNNDWFFIEEPELNLHPGLQRIFIETLLNDKYLKSKNLRYFFTTHSNHFLDISIPRDDISIFQFKSVAKDKFHIKTDVKPCKDILDILGVNTSSVFLANTSIWVEGPTDRKYLSKLLKLYYEYKNSQPLKEDIDFAFFEYGGNLIGHYLFDEEIEGSINEVREKINSFALSNKIFLLADNDNADKKSVKGKRRLALEDLSAEQTNFTYQNTILKEIENLLPKQIIKGFMSELVTGEANLKKVGNIDFERKAYKNIGLGKFYEDLLKKAKIPKKYLKSFKAKSGTLTNNYKIKLSNFVINSSYKYDDFIKNNEELNNIVKTLYSFIKK